MNVPELLVSLSVSKTLDVKMQVGRPGVKTRSLQALLLGAAEKYGQRQAVLKALWRWLQAKDSTEVLTPVRRDPPSLIPFIVVLSSLLINPSNATKMAQEAVNAYSVKPDTIALLKKTFDGEIG